MTTDTASRFSEAAQHERELSDRQRQVLRLVEKGHTNREIADMLGMSVDGAKWNVSEILTKLGLASREEAAEYWRWRHGGAWSRVRGWLGAPLLKVAGAGAAAVVGVGVVAGLLGDDQPPVVAAWVLEGEFYERRELPRWEMEPPENADRGTVRWIRVDDLHWRIEVTSTTNHQGRGSSLIVADGEFIHFYDGRVNWHYRVPIEWMPEEVVKGFASGGGFFRTVTGSLDDYVAARKKPDGHPDWHKPDAWRAGTDRVLGLPVELVESTPSWSNGEFHTSGGVRREWIEPTHMLVVKTTSEGNDGSEQRASTVTSLRFETEVDPAELEFRPPVGSCDMGEGTPRRPNDEIPEGVQDVDQWLREQRCGP